MPEALSSDRGEGLAFFIRRLDSLADHADAFYDSLECGRLASGLKGHLNVRVALALPLLLHADIGLPRLAPRQGLQNSLSVKQVHST